jgi:hypothetical protein
MNGEVTNKPNTHSGHLDWMDICKESAKVQFLKKSIGEGAGEPLGFGFSSLALWFNG